MFTKATKEDITTIQDLAKKSWEFTYSDILGHDQIDYMLDLMYSNEKLTEHFENHNYQYYIIRLENPVGFVGVEFDYEINTTKLHRIYFIQEAQGKGLGKKTIEFIKQKALEVRNSRLILTVNKNNPAKDFYHSQGFHIYDEGIFDVGGGYVMDDYLMELVFTDTFF